MVKNVNIGILAGYLWPGVICPIFSMEEKEKGEFGHNKDNNKLCARGTVTKQFWSRSRENWSITKRERIHKN